MRQLPKTGIQVFLFYKCKLYHLSSIGSCPDLTMTKTAEAKMNEIKHCVLSIFSIGYENCSYGPQDFGARIIYQQLSSVCRKKGNSRFTSRERSPMPSVNEANINFGSAVAQC